MNPLTIGGLILIGILTLACGALWKVAGYEREARAVAEANSRQWQATALECSVATEKAAKTAQDAQKRAQDALKKARIGAASTQAEIERLRASNAASCQAAVKTVRDGLRQ